MTTLRFSSAQSPLPSLTSSGVQAALAQRRKRWFDYSITNLARAVDKEPFVAGLRRWVMPAVLLSSATWLAVAAAKADNGSERQKRITQYGLSALGTILAAWAGFKFILKPDPNNAGRLGSLILEHMGELLPKKQLAKLADSAEELLEKNVDELGVGHLFDKKVAQKPLEEALEDLEDPNKLFQLLEHFNVPLGKFKSTVEAFAKESAEHKNGLTAGRLQEFRNAMLTHILGEHGLQTTEKMTGWLSSFTRPRVFKKNVRALRHQLEELVTKVDDWADDALETGKEVLTKRRYRKAANGKDKAAAYGQDKQARKLLNVVVDGPGDISSNEMYEEIGELSLMGALPVGGGILGGILGDMAVGENSKRGMATKFKEGLFQYLANIMLCNVGAMLFIGGTEKLAGANWGKVSTWAGKTSTRIGAMIAGIMVIGVVGGSAIANFVGENFLNPLFDGGWNAMTEHLRERTRDDGFKGLFKNLYAHRVPEPLDVMLHIDDFATGAAISGLTFVEPFLALFYTLSGIRAGIGYRNREAEEAENTQASLPTFPNAYAAASPPSASIPLPARLYQQPRRPLMPPNRVFPVAGSPINSFSVDAQPQAATATNTYYAAPQQANYQAAAATQRY